MKTECWSIGATSEDYLKKGVAIYVKRLQRYIPFTWVEHPDVKLKSSDGKIIAREEGKYLLQKLTNDDYLVLLDEKGLMFTSVELAKWMETRLSDSKKRLVFLIGGAFGFSPEVYERANAQISLSKLTFSHQMVRLFWAEQVYRAMTILHNEPYHNE